MTTIYVMYNNNNQPTHIIKSPKNAVKRLALAFEKRLYEHVFSVSNMPHVPEYVNSHNKLTLRYIMGETLYTHMENTKGYYMLQHPDVFFQIVWSLCVFQIMGIMHHDLHFNNIIINERPNFKYYEYTIGEDCVFRGWSNIHVFIIDFDHGTKYSTPQNTTHITNHALKYWVDVGARNKNVIVGYDWFTFLYYLNTYPTAYPKYRKKYNIPDVRPLPILTYPGRPITLTNEICRHVLHRIGSPLCILKQWRFLPYPNIHMMSGLPLPPYTYTHNRKTLSLFQTCPYNIPTKLSEYIWLIHIQHPAFDISDKHIYVCQPLYNCCFRIEKNSVEYDTVPCVYATVRADINITEAQNNKWAASDIQSVINVLNLSWSHFLIPSHLLYAYHTHILLMVGGKTV